MTVTPLRTLRPHNAAGTDAAPLRRGRAIHLVDIENLVAGNFDRAWMRTAWQLYTSLVVPGDAVVVAASAYAAQRSFFDLPGYVSKRVVHGGKNAADRALIDAFDVHHHPTRYAWLVLASNDGALASLAPVAKLAGMRVWAVSGMSEGTRVTKAADVSSRLNLPRASRVALSA